MTLAIKFRDHIIEFLDELIEQFPNEAELIITRIFVKDQINPIDIADSFSESLISHQDIIKRRDERYFIDNDNLFSYFDSTKVLYFKKIWLSGVLDDDDKDTMWSWIDSFVLLAKKYLKQKEKNLSSVE